MSRSASISLLLVALIATILMSLVIGPVAIDHKALFSGQLDNLQTLILVDIRLPRIYLNVVVGAGIATAGAAIQGLFRNPLADPALIGVSSGAALFAAGFMVLGFEGALLQRLGVSGSAFIGGLLTSISQ